LHCGSFIESGCDTRIPAETITNCFGSVSPEYVDSAEVIQPNMLAVDEDDESYDRDETLGKVIEQVSTRLACHASEWHALEAFWRPAVVARTMLSDDSSKAAASACPNPGLLKQRRVAKRAVEIGFGNGPQEMNETLTACWNFYTHHAISGGKTVLADGNSFATGHWIWNEESSADIFDCMRQANHSSWTGILSSNVRFIASIRLVESVDSNR